MGAKLEAQHEERIALAWGVERFAREKALKPLETYLAPAGAADRRAEMIARIRALQRGGKAIQIRKVSG